MSKKYYFVFKNDTKKMEINIKSVVLVCIVNAD